MKNSRIEIIIYVFFVLFFLNSCILNKSKSKQKKEVLTNHLKFKNKSKIPLIKNCKNNQTKECLLNSINNMILSEVNERNLILTKDTLKIGVRINKDGTTSILKNETTNLDLKNVTFDVLSSMNIIEPAYFESQNSYKAVAYFWYVFIENNELVSTPASSDGFLYGLAGSARARRSPR